MALAASGGGLGCFLLAPIAAEAAPTLWVGRALAASGGGAGLWCFSLAPIAAEAAPTVGVGLFGDFF